MPKCPKISMTSDDVASIEVTGNPRNQEPVHVRIYFPGGKLELVRAEDGAKAEYWCHIHINHTRDNDGLIALGEQVAGKVTDGRLDIVGKHASECDEGDFDHPDLYHVAVRVAPQRKR